MDIFVIDPETWEPIGDPIKYRESTIWTERFQPSGSATITSKNISYMRQKLPIGTLVSHRRTREVFIVETHSIEAVENTKQIKIECNSLTSYINHRVIGNISGESYKGFIHSNVPSMAKILYNSFVNTTNYDMTINPPVASAYKNINDAIPNLVITDSVTVPAGLSNPTIRRYFDPGYIANYINKLLQYIPSGFRIIRPGPNNDGKVITVTTGGSYNTTQTTNITALRMDLYTGTDRSIDQDDVEPVIFDALGKDLQQPSYLFSSGVFKNEAHIVLPTGAIFAYNQQEIDPLGTGLTGTQSALSGLNRRVLFIDGGTPEDGYDTDEWEDYSIDQAEKELEDHKKYSLVDGEVSYFADQKFGVDYFLGDVVTVRGEYGQVAKARVTEFIMNEDKDGERNFPGFTYI